MSGRYVDGELAHEMGEQLRAHAAGCPSCAAALQELKDLRGLLSSLPDGAPPVGFASAIVEAARFSRFSTPRHLSPTHIWGRIAAALLIASSGLYLGIRFQAAYTSVAKPPAQTVSAGAALSETAEFELVPPQSPGALCLALLEVKPG